MFCEKSSVKANNVIYNHLPMKDYLNKVRKVTFEEFKAVYDRGFSDKKSAAILDISHSRVYGLRRKYGLVANCPRNGLASLTPEELKEANERFKKSDSKYKVGYFQKTKKRQQRLSKSYYHSSPKLKDYAREYAKVNSHKWQERIDNYEKTEKRKHLKREAVRKYYYKHRKVKRSYKAKHSYIAKTINVDECFSQSLP